MLAIPDYWPYDPGNEFDVETFCKPCGTCCLVLSNGYELNITFTCKGKKGADIRDIEYRLSIESKPSKPKPATSIGGIEREDLEDGIQNHLG